MRPEPDRTAPTWFDLGVRTPIVVPAATPGSASADWQPIAVLPTPATWLQSHGHELRRIEVRLRAAGSPDTDTEK